MIDFQCVTKGQKFSKKNLGRSHPTDFIKTFYTPVPPWLSISYVSNTTDRSFPGGYIHCQNVAVCRNLLKINPLHRLPKQSTLYNLYNYLKINTLSPAGVHRPCKWTPGPRRSAARPEWPRPCPVQITRHGEPWLKRFNFVCRSWRGQSSSRSSQGWNKTI